MTITNYNKAGEVVTPENITTPQEIAEIIGNLAEAQNDKQTKRH